MDIFLEIGWDILHFQDYLEKKYLTKGEHFFDKYGFWGVFLAGITPIPYKIIAWLAGIFEMNKSLFGAGTFIGRFPRFLLVAYFGYELRNINFSLLWDTMWNINIQLFYLINSHNNWILDKFNILLSQTTYIVIGILTLAMFAKYRDLSKRIILGLGITFLIVFLLKFGINEPRPYLSLDGVHLLLNEGTEPSFPSNHTTMSFALSTMLFKYPNTKKIGAILFIWALLVGYSRIYAGVHYPFDVAFGAILGIACGWFAMNFENVRDYLYKIFK
ncbi:phosphatase PAP2 family protein [Methanococcus aeolicus]|uniref:phosphatase PAP2 family protein n=1 Tax=Methanococcus aeolicus TaxID=42879 RepID=UPI0021C83B4B|nr:phosphatase PAP2 family protein [Methanococcus aeolicus]UXM85079.1 phosphatase PAP2 family protein [Methanococcus aeolicus]